MYWCTCIQGLAVIFHLVDTGLEGRVRESHMRFVDINVIKLTNHLSVTIGFPLGITEAHQYAFEPAALYALIFLFFVANGGGKLSLDSALRDD